MDKRSIVLLGIFLGSHAPVAAQAPAPQIVLAEGHLAPIITMLRTVSTPLQTASFLLYQDPGKSPAHFSHVFAGAYEGDHRIARLPPMEEVKTLFFTQSSLPIVQLWGGRLQLDAFQSTFHIQNVQLLGPLGFRSTQGFRSARQGYSVGPRSVYFSGLSLSFHFGRDARTGRPIQAWRCLSRIVGNVIG
jgi:hypothetical protein